MHSWIFRNRRRLERLYGLAPARPEAEPRALPARAARPDPTPKPGALPARVLIPAPRRVA